MEVKRNNRLAVYTKELIRCRYCCISNVVLVAVLVKLKVVNGTIHRFTIESISAYPPFFAVLETSF